MASSAPPPQASPLPSNPPSPSDKIDAEASTSSEVALSSGEETKLLASVVAEPPSDTPKADVQGTFELYVHP
eukprot:5121736-Amphidinium_carterae.1